MSSDHRHFVIEVDKHPVSIQGDPNMDAKTMGLLEKMIRAAIRHTIVQAGMKAYLTADMELED